MDDLLKIFSPQVFNTIGVIVVVFVIIFKDQLGRFIFRRKADDPDSEDFVERRKTSVTEQILQEFLKHHDTLISQIQNFTEALNKTNQTILAHIKEDEEERNHALERHEKVLIHIQNLIEAIVTRRVS